MPKYTETGLEQKVDELDTKIELMLTNHLPHLKEDIISLKTRVNVMTAINIGGIIIGILVAKFLK